eukprot:4927599-Amphidinium_carterae.1
MCPWTAPPVVWHDLSPLATATAVSSVPLSASAEPFIPAAWSAVGHGALPSDPIQEWTPTMSSVMP